jgi:hypothetical protein
MTSSVDQSYIPILREQPQKYESKRSTKQRRLRAQEELGAKKDIVNSLGLTLWLKDREKKHAVYYPVV